jgi:uncharacterized membrane protein YjgN (DUF898 family)
MSLNSGGIIRYSGQSSPFFKLAFVTGLLTVITLGIYRFWAKTRLRKYIWSSISVDGDAFEYTGTGLEKLLGFLVAIVFLAVYLAGIQLILTFAGLGIVSAQENELAVLASVYLSFFAVVPFLLFAIYRSRRYKLARTRFRGIRFGMESAAWGYALRAIGHYLLTALTFGILLPRQSFYLEKFMTDRSYYGDARFEQGGRWQMLYAALKHVLIGLGLLIVGGIIGGLAVPTFGAVLGVVGYFWFIIGFVYYRVKSYAIMANHKTLGGQVTFTAEPSTGKILKIVILGGLALALAAGVAFGILGAIVATSVSGSGLANTPSMAVIIPMVIVYLLIIAALGALALVMITQPVIAHLATTLRIHNSEALAGVQQRASDAGADADGFADALDIGGAI